MSDYPRVFFVWHTPRESGTHPAAECGVNFEAAVTPATVARIAGWSLVNRLQIAGCQANAKEMKGAAMLHEEVYILRY
jgi:hypothetical protein